MPAAALNGGFGSADLKVRSYSPRQLYTPLQDLHSSPLYGAPATVISAQLSSFKAPSSPHSLYLKINSPNCFFGDFESRILFIEI